MKTPVIHCTGKLSSLLGVKAAPIAADADAWNANLFAYNGRKCVILVHARTSYCLLAFDVVKADLKDFPDVFRQLLHHQLAHEWPMHAALIEAWMAQLPPAIAAATNNDRSTLGIINRYTRTVQYVLSRHHEPLGEQAAFLEAWNLNDGIIGSDSKAGKASGEKWGYIPGERMAAHVGIPFDRKDYSERQSKALRAVTSGEDDKWMRVVM
ncbi:MAG: hypothetical protein IPG35_07220 [Flavobacteriales bacterium]|nr:hypothetical protein [Flavobacteriales bacterium]MBK9699048.1 hypothetical protein [Flavobacteriales bacterium]